jgi:hypothetical protein
MMCGVTEPAAAPGRGGDSRDRLLQLADEELTRLCRVERCRGTGPGGQKRNKTESAVTVTHEPSGCRGSADDTRSQHTNRHVALRRLRQNLAFEWRLAPPGVWPFADVPAPKADVYPLWSAKLLDVLAANGWRLAESADFCSLSTGQLVKALGRDPALWTAVNRSRQAAGLPTLRD